MRPRANEMNPYLPDHYFSGAKILEGDIVKIDGTRLATISAVFLQGGNYEYNYGLDGGGFLTEETNGNLIAWSEADEDIELIRRARR